MESGTIFLGKLYDFVKKDPDGKSLLGTSRLGHEYATLASAITSTVPNERGFYLWGKYDPNGLWRNIYLGKAMLGKTAHLRARILEELKDERMCLWRHVMTERQLLDKTMENYGGRYNGRGNKSFKRSIYKAETSHIIWVAVEDLGESQVRNIESDLIETLNPVANIVRPSPPAELQELTVEVIKHFRRQIHSRRTRPFANFKVFA